MRKPDRDLGKETIVDDVSHWRSSAHDDRFLTELGHDVSAAPGQASRQIDRGASGSQPVLQPQAGDLPKVSGIVRDQREEAMDESGPVAGGARRGCWYQGGSSLRELPRRRSMAITLEVFENPIILFGPVLRLHAGGRLRAPRPPTRRRARRLLRCTDCLYLDVNLLPLIHAEVFVKLDNRAVNPGVSRARLDGERRVSGQDGIGGKGTGRRRRDSRLAQDGPELRRKRSTEPASPGGIA